MDNNVPNEEPTAESEESVVTTETPAEEEIQEQAAQASRRGEIRYRFASRKQRPWLRFLGLWRELLLGLFLVTAVLFILNPFANIALATATAAAPSEPLAVTPPAAPEQGYCLTGNFLEWNGSDTPLVDDGTEGDAVAGDGIYSRALLFSEAGKYAWRVLPCGDWESAVPERSAWVFTDEPDQVVTFTFNPTGPGGNEWPNSYLLTADDQFPENLAVIGSFQPRNWNNKDYETIMWPVGDGLYELVYSVSLPGTYEAYVTFEGRRDGFGADGRSSQPVPLQFSTQTATELVVFQYNEQTERIAVYYDIPGWLSWIGFDLGASVIAAVALVGALVMGVLVGYQRIVLNPDKQYRAGCPQCQHTPLRRVNRITSDYLLNVIGIPVRRYKCTECGWEGRRIRR